MRWGLTDRRGIDRDSWRPATLPATLEPAGAWHGAWVFSGRPAANQPALRADVTDRPGLFRPAPRSQTDDRARRRTPALCRPAPKLAHRPGSADAIDPHRTRSARSTHGGRPPSYGHRATSSANWRPRGSVGEPTRCRGSITNTSSLRLTRRTAASRPVDDHAGCRQTAAGRLERLKRRLRPYRRLRPAVTGG